MLEEDVDPHTLVDYRVQLEILTWICDVTGQRYRLSDNKLECRRLGDEQGLFVGDGRPIVDAAT